jgi:Kef-type K+ transport system membrane component KefB
MVKGNQKLHYDMYASYLAVQVEVQSFFFAELFFASVGILLSLHQTFEHTDLYCYLAPGFHQWICWLGH